MDIFKMIEIFGAVWLILAIFMLGRKNCKWWLFYAAANIPFSVVTLHDTRYWYAVMGFIMMLTGIKNYCVAREKEKIEVKKEVMSHLR